MKNLDKYLTIVLVAFAFLVSAQTKVTVKGKVIAESDGGPIPGATILTGSPLKGIGVTDVDGLFTISVTPGSKVIFKSIGFLEKGIVIGKKDYIEVRMEDDTKLLKEVVKVAYADKTKETVSGAVTTISAKDIQDIPAANVIEILQGKIPGLNIQNTTGSPGAPPAIFSRGLTNISISGSGDNAFLTPTSPLFVIDGIPVDANTNYEYGFASAGPGISPLSLIPTEDIESISVLRDAQATALYGGQGAYGVILITTKRGNSKKPIIRYTSNYFVNTPPRLREVIGGKRERQLRIWQYYNFAENIYEARERINNNQFFSDSSNVYYNNSTNWQDIFYKSTFNQTQNISALGGDDRFNYKINLGYFDENGIVRNTGFSRYSLNMNTQYRPNEEFSLFAGLTSSLGKSNRGSGNGVLQTGVATASSASSLLPAPSLFSSSSATLGAFNVENDNKTGNIKVNVQGRYAFIPSLAWTTRVSYDYTTGTEETFKPAIINNNSAQTHSYDDRRSTLYNYNSLNYAKTFDKKHNVNINIFSEFYGKNFQANVIRQVDGPNDQYEGPFGYNAQSGLGGVLDNYSESRSLSFASALSYNFDQKYVFDVTYRLDRSSQNGSNKPWAHNPSLGFRYNFNKENLLQDLKWLDYSSLRLTWGKNIVPNGTVFDSYGVYDFAGSFNNSQAIGLGFKYLPNTNLLPTTVTQYNLGFDLGLYEGKYTLTFDTYYKTSENQLWDKDLANHNAFDKIKSNEASNVNYGYELAIAIRPLPSASLWRWTLSFNGAINREVLTKLPNGARQHITDGGDATAQPTFYRLGRNSLSNLLYDNKGVYRSSSDVQVDPATGLPYRTGSGANRVYFEGGDPIWSDINGDYILDERDLVVSGNSMPLATGGASSFIQYKQFSLNVALSYTYKRSILNNPLATLFQNYANVAAQKNLPPIEGYDYWKFPGDEAVYPNPFDYKRYGSYSKGASIDYFLPYRYNQDLFQEDGSYLKINSVTLAYTIDSKWIRRFGITSLRMNLTTNNLYTFSAYSGANPENVSTLGRDQSDGFPTRRSYSLGLNVQF